jgi:hypothetical protein
LLFAVATQAQKFIGSYPGYSLLPATTSVQWLSQPSVFNHVYPYPAAVNYRGVVGNAVAPWFYYNNPYTTEVQTSADVKDVAGTSGAIRTKRQIQLRYRGGSRRGRSLDTMDKVKTDVNNVDETASSRPKRQILLRYRPSSRRGRSLNNELIKPVYPAYSQFDTDAALVRTPRQILLRYRNSAAGRRRHGRSINE